MLLYYLIITGSNPSNYISYRVKDFLIKRCGKELKTLDKPIKVYSNKVENPISVTECVEVPLSIYNSVSHKVDKFLVKCLVLDSDKDVIIGYPTIKETPLLKHALFTGLCDVETLDEIRGHIQFLKEQETVVQPKNTLSNDQVIEALNIRIRQLEEEKLQLKKEKEERKHILAEQKKLGTVPPVVKEGNVKRSKRMRKDKPTKATRLQTTRITGKSKKRLERKERIERRLALSNTVQEEDPDFTPEEIECHLADQEEGEDSNEPPYVSCTGDSHAWMPGVIEGDDELKELQRKLLEKHRSVFSVDLRMESADLPPMHIRVNDTWDRPENRRAPRPLSKKQQEEVDKQVDTFLGAKVIRISKASAHSQVLLVQKPDSSWRFCIDFRRLNLSSEPTSWPIPNIKEMLQRIGAKRPRYIAVFDLTKGYYQAPLAESSKHLTAFITSKGLYEWNRVAMGLMGAPAYFQRVMTTIVLAGILHVGCEVYMDDIIIYGHTKEEYLKNLDDVLTRLGKHRLTANPKKCKMGLSEVTYVGYRINEQGISFSREQLQSVIDFPRPETAQQLRSFLGLANYFRDHIRNYSDIANPLNDMTKNYTRKMRNTKVTWNSEAEAAFEKLKKVINECPTLFFMDDEAEIHLYTDASKIGVGAYLCQVKEVMVDGKLCRKEYPIGFMSKTLTDTQRRWSVPEREAYAIVEATRKWAYLIRDVPFTLHTDHKNLIYIRDTGSMKVTAWKLQLQEFTFSLSYVKGEDNNIADALSRNAAASPCDEEPETPAVNKFFDVNQDEYTAELFVKYQFQIPQQQYDLIKSCHNALTGHNGLEATIQKLKDL